MDGGRQSGLERTGGVWQECLDVAGVADGASRVGGEQVDEDVGMLSEAADDGECEAAFAVN